MSLFQYKVTLANGKSKSGQITAKTEEVARTKLSELYTILDWDYIRVKAAPLASAVKDPVAKPPQPAKVTLVSKTAAAKATKLDKLLYLQNGKCFFCGRVLTKAEASVEHLLPKSKGGTDADGNVVACCVTLNRTFGSMELKDKVRFVLSQKGDFKCPKA